MGIYKRLQYNEKLKKRSLRREAFKMVLIMIVEAITIGLLFLAFFVWLWII